ncbi:hypothetical protein D3C73_1556580 [compost metagenome]
MPEHDIGQVKVTVLDTGLELLRTMLAQPLGQAIEPWQPLGPGPTGIVFDTVQLRQPA